MNTLKIILIVIGTLIVIGVGGLVAYFELRTPGPTLATEMAPFGYSTL